MATDKEQREVEIILKAQEANASIKDMAAGVALMNNQLAKMSQDDPRREQMKQDFQDLRGRLKEASDEMRGLVKTEEQLREEAEKLNQANAQVILNGQKVSASFKDMKEAGAILERQLHELAADDPGRKKLLDDYRALQERMEGVKKEMGQAQQESNTFRDALAFAGVTVGAEAILEGVKELAGEIIATTKEVETLRGSINTLTGATGPQLDGLTTSVLAISRTFGKDFNEVLGASNALSKQMGVSQQEALRLVQQGFLAGADAGGDFLDQVKEYAPQFKAAGYAADQFIGHISQSATEGVFSDKGADVVKEFGLRIREQTKSTTDAMQAAFGSDFTTKLFAGINDGSVSVQQALQQVSEQMDKTKIPANQLQTVIADVFGGPGEDAGADYLKSLHKVGAGVDTMVDKTNVYTQRQERLLKSQTDLAAAQNELTKELEGSGTIMESLGNESMTVLYTMLASLGATFRELAAPVKEIWNSLTDLARSMGWVSKEGTTAKDVGQALGKVISWMFLPTKLLYGVIADIVTATVEWAKGSVVAQAALTVMTAPVRTLYALLTNGPAYFAAFSAAAESSFGSIGRAWKRVLDRDFSGAGDEMRGLGKKAGDAYNQAFALALADKALKASAPEAAKVEEEKKGKQGGDGMTDADRAKAEKEAKQAADKAAKERQAARNKADQEHLDALKRMTKEETSEIDLRNTLRLQAQQRALSDEQLRREEQRKKIVESAEKQVDQLTGLEQDYTARVEAIVTERDLRLRELTAKFAEQDEKDRQAAIDEKIKLNEAQLAEDLAALELKLSEGVLNQQTYDEAIFQAKMAARDRELAWIKEKNGQESAEYKRLNAERLKDLADHNGKAKKEDEDLGRFKGRLRDLEKILNNENVKFVEENLGKQTVLYKAFQATRKALAIADIGMAYVEEVQQYWNAAAKMGPVAGPIYGLAMSGVATVRSGMAIAKVMGFRQGGATGDGVSVQQANNSMWDVLGNATGLTIGTNGKLQDGDGYEVAGIVHTNEYVIPEWMRQDPQVMQVENWLEARRQRGFYDGGPTSESARALSDDKLPTTSGGQNLERLTRVLESLDSRLQLVEQWPEKVQVVQDVLGLYRDLERLKEIDNSSGIRTAKTST